MIQLCALLINDSNLHTIETGASKRCDGLIRCLFIHDHVRKGEWGLFLITIKVIYFKLPHNHRLIVLKFVILIKSPQKPCGKNVGSDVGYAVKTPSNPVGI
jgi:hypothetical protein